MKLLVLDDKSLGKNVLKKYNEEDIIPYNYDKFKNGEMIVELKKLLDEMMYGMIFIIPFLIFKNNSLYHFVLCNKNMIKLGDEIKRG